jgi:DNA-binding MarR family transcriptional regulator
MTDNTKTQENVGQMTRRPIRSIREALSFRIARMAAINERAGGQHFKSEFDLTLMEWRILGLTAAMQPVSFAELRDILLVDKGLLSRTIKALVARGLIDTRKLKSDARQIELLITPVGTSLHDNVLEFTIERNAAMAAVLTDQEWAAFDQALDKLLEHNQNILIGKDADHG